MSKDSEIEDEMNPEQGSEQKSTLSNYMKHFLPALLALITALTAWLSNNSDLSSINEDRIKAEVTLSNRVNQLELQAAELKGEQKTQRELLTELRLDIREIKTLLESKLGKSGGKI